MASDWQTREATMQEGGGQIVRPTTHDGSEARSATHDGGGQIIRASAVAHEHKSGQRNTVLRPD